MRTPYALTLILVLLLGGTYWLSHAESACRVPLAYRIGSIDPSFDLSSEEARIALMEAEAVWENAIGKNLFTYEEDAEFTVNFVYDERQALANAEENLRERLDASENATEEIDETYATLVATYEERSAQYEARVAAYEARLDAYNAKVESYNNEGGAPPEVYEELKAEQIALDAEQVEINALAARLNELVADINRIGEEGNRRIDFHNQQVERYNETFGESREFTQGDYYRDEINIYTFTDRKELVAVLAHELGHALSLSHVENETSIMYYLMGGQPDALALSAEDLAEFNAMCNVSGPFNTLKEWKRDISTWLSSLSVL